MASADHCSLRWNNHQAHLLRSFDALLQTKTLVDVTLVCAETSFRAHKVVLSACSPFFERLFAETPCKHPVIALTDIRGWVLQAIVDFMYRGEISVPREHLRQLIQAGESLQVRGLTDHSIVAPLVGISDSSPAPSSPDLSPQPRRKQARPRRRSGEEPQDLSNGGATSAGQTKLEQRDVTSSDEDEIEDKMAANDNNNNSTQDEEKENQPSSLQIAAAAAAESAAAAALEQRERDALQERFILSLKDIRHLNRNFRPTPPPPPPPPSLHLFTHHQQLLQQQHNIIQQQQQQQQHDSSRADLKQEHDRSDNESPFMELMDLSQPTFGSKNSANFSYQPPGAAHQPPSPLHFPAMSSALTLTPPHMFGLDSPLGLFDPAKMYNPLMEMPDPRNLLQDHHHPHHQPFLKKKLSRPKGQHSAPRGGPPRSWTNAELTEALQHVWNKKMTTSQASRIFGIPYNSLLMYVRGKYGKSLKLEQLRKDCISGPPIELLQMGNSSSRKSDKSLDGACPPESVGRSASSEPELMSSPHMFHPFPAGAFYPDFGALQLQMMNFQPQQQPKGGGDRNRERDDEKSKEDDDYQPLASIH